MLSALRNHAAPTVALLAGLAVISCDGLGKSTFRPDAALVTGWATLHDLDSAPVDSTLEGDPKYAFDFSEAEEIVQVQTAGDLVFDSRGQGTGLFFQLPEAVYDVVIDMGIVDLSSMTQAPREGYQASAPARVDHAYWIRTLEGHYAKVKVTAATNTQVEFNYAYKSDGSRAF